MRPRGTEASLVDSVARSPLEHVAGRSPEEEGVEEAAFQAELQALGVGNREVQAEEQVDDGDSAGNGGFFEAVGIVVLCPRVSSAASLGHFALVSQIGDPGLLPTTNPLPSGLGLADERRIFPRTTARPRPAP